MQLVSAKFKSEIIDLPPDEHGVVKQKATGKKLCHLVIAYERPEMPTFLAWLRTVKQTCGLGEEDAPKLPSK